MQTSSYLAGSGDADTRGVVGMAQRPIDDTRVEQRVEAERQGAAIEFAEIFTWNWHRH